MRKRIEILTFALRQVAETDVAIGCTDLDAETDDVKYWLPKSQVEYDSVGRGDIVDVQMPRWLADAKGLEE